MKQFSWLLLIGICILAGMLRLYGLGANPPALTWDEAAWGYNAYALGIDGRDEFGKFLPYEYLESFGDFKPPVYAYAALIPIKLFGLNEFATRFPSALFGILTVLLSYFLVKRLFYGVKYVELYALFTAFLLAVSPWHIMLSRAAFEANVVTFLLVLGIWLFLKAIQENPWYLVISAISFALSFYTFNTPRIVAPILVLLLGVSFYKELFKVKKQLISAIVVGALLVLPLTPFLLSPQASLRFKEVNIFTDAEVIKRANQEIANDNNAYWSKILHHRKIIYGFEYIRHYLDHFTFEFLFMKGDSNPKFSTRDVGSLYIFEIPFFIAGIIILLKRREGYWWLVPLWMLIAIIPAATARETPHALRIATSLPMFQLFSAIGLTWFVVWLKKYPKAVQGAAFVLLVFMMLFNISYFVHGYYAHYPREYSTEWQYGYKESIQYVASVADDYDEIHITDAMGRPYAYYLFYLKTDPRDFRKEAVVHRDAFGFVSVSSFDKFKFLRIVKPGEKTGKKILYVSTPGEMPKGGNVLREFKSLNGQTQLVAYII